MQAMPNLRRRAPRLLLLALLACSLSGCGSISGWLADGMEDYFPQWAGGLPADAPPRPGTAKYDEWMKERELRRLEPAAKAEGAATASSPGAIH